MKNKKTCSSCNRTLPLEKFSINNNTKDGHQNMCKECAMKYWRKHYEENKKKIKKYHRAHNFLYSNENRGGGYLKGTGICIFCGETNPFKLELHHPFGRDNDFLIHLCGSCHVLQHRYPAMLEIELC